MFIMCYDAEKWQLSQLYGVEEKRAWVAALVRALQRYRQTPAAAGETRSLATAKGGWWVRQREGGRVTDGC